MQFGIFSESGFRRNASTADAYEEDLFEVVTADRLGFSEAWIAEPNNVRANAVTHAYLLMAMAAGQTRQIKFGSGIRQLPLHNPVGLVQEANSIDQLTRGRYIFGYGGTHLVTLEQLHQRGIDAGHDDTRPMVYEALDLMLRCWNESEPFDFEGRYWHGKDIHVLPRPYQQPHPPIAAGCSGSSETIEVAARHGFIPLFGRGNDTAEEIRQWAEVYRKAAEGVGIRPARSSFRVTRLIYVAETDQKAREDLRPTATRLIEDRKRVAGVYLLQKLPPGGTLDDITFDSVCESGEYWIGSPDTVCQYIQDYYDQTGGFGTLLYYAGLPVLTQRKRARSMRLLMEEVAPRLAHLDPDREPALAR